MNSETQTQREMPRYRCHKEVWALKIRSITYDADLAQKENRETDGSMTLVFEEDDKYGPMKVPAKFVPRTTAGRPHSGWYFVAYKDGYQSFSPPQAFEEGYTKI